MDETQGSQETGLMLCFHAELPVQSVLVNHQRQTPLSKKKEQTFLESSKGRKDTPQSYLPCLLGSVDPTAGAHGIPSSLITESASAFSWICF